MTRTVAASCAVVDRAGRDLLLAQPTLPTPLDQRHPHGAHRRHRRRGRRRRRPQRDDPARRRSQRPPARDRRRGGGGPRAMWRAWPTAAPPAQTPAVIRSGPPRRASCDEGAVRPGRGTPRPGGARRRARSCAAPRPACRRPRRPAHDRAAGGVRAAAAAKKSASSEDQHQRAVPVEGAGPGQPDAVAAQPGQPPRPHPRPQREPAQAPVEQRGSRPGRAATTPRVGATAPGGRRPRPRGRPRGPGAAGRSQERRVPPPGRSRCRPGCPRRGTPRRPRRPRRGGPRRPRRRPCAAGGARRYCGRACGAAHDDRLLRPTRDAQEHLPSSSQARVDGLVVAPLLRARSSSMRPSDGAEQHLPVASEVRPLAVEEGARRHGPASPPLCGLRRGTRKPVPCSARGDVAGVGAERHEHDRGVLDRMEQTGRLVVVGSEQGGRGRGGGREHRPHPPRTPARPTTRPSRYRPARAARPERRARTSTPALAEARRERPHQGGHATVESPEQGRALGVRGAGPRLAGRA